MRVTKLFLTEALGNFFNGKLRDIMLQGRNSLDVNIQDQHTKAFDIDFHQSLGVTAIAIAIEPGDYSFTAAPGHGISVGEHLKVWDKVGGISFECVVLTVATDDIGIDTPANGSYAVVSTTVTRATRDLNVDGSSTRETFDVTNPFSNPWDITRVLFIMTTTALPELDMFGDIIGGLSRGMVFRSVVNGAIDNYYNVKSNADLVKLMYDVTFYEPAKHGVYGLCGRLTYSGQEKHGVTLRLGEDERLEMIVQDNLSTLLSFRVSVAGHLTEGE